MNENLNQNENAEKQELLNSMLSKVQHEAVSDEFIYGITSRAGRKFSQKINDFLIDHSAVPGKEIAYFFELLATMIQAGIPLNRSLKILIHKTENKRLQRIIATLSFELEHGRSLGQALERFPDVFEESQRGMVRSAEAVGNLETVLYKIAKHLERKNSLYMRLMGALIYPITVIGALIVGIIVMMTFVVPKIREIFAQSTLELPFATRVLLDTSTVFSDYWWLLLILIILGTIGFHFYTHSEEGRFSWDFKKLQIPFAGNLLRKIFVLRFVDTLGMLIESGLPINKSIEFVATTIGNEVYRVKIYETLGSVQEGRPLSASLATAPFLFPETVTNMLAVGEQAAAVGEISQKIGDHYEREIDHTLKNLTTVVGPVLILAIGLIVAFFAIAVLSPIFSLTESVI